MYAVQPSSQCQASGQSCRTISAKPALERCNGEPPFHACSWVLHLAPHRCFLVAIWSAASAAGEAGVAHGWFCNFLQDNAPSDKVRRHKQELLQLQIQNAKLLNAKATLESEAVAVAAKLHTVVNELRYFQDRIKLEEEQLALARTSAAALGSASVGTCTC